jgi:hypothetical protein
LFRCISQCQQQGNACPPLLKCPVCYRSRARFYCQECVARGDFVYSNTTSYEHYAEKRLRLLASRRNVAETKAAIAGQAGLAIKNTPKKTQKNNLKKTKNVFFGFFKFLIFYENNTYFSL